MKEADPAWLARIESLRDTRELMSAAQEAAAYCATFPQDVSGRKLRAELHFRCGQRDEGFREALAAVELDPADIPYGLDCAFNLIRDGRRLEALRICDLLDIQDLRDPHLHDALGTAFTFCEEPGKALPHFQQAVTADPSSSVFLYNLASVQRMFDSSAAAEINLDRVLEIEPTDGRAQWARSALRPQTPERNHILELKVRLAGATTQANRVFLGYALAKELEDVGQHRQSFQELCAAAKAYRKGFAYNSGAELVYLDKIRSANYDLIDGSSKPTQGPRPIFVMGLPRSGTTLVDRIITSIPQVVSAGEFKALSAAIWQGMHRNRSSPGVQGDAVTQMLSRPAQIAQAYRSALSRWETARAVVDKTPSNYLFAGFIMNALPEAKIICLRRNAMDSCYALFKTLFADGHQFSYDLDELGAYYIKWHELISHWESRGSRQWLTVRYEDLVSDSEQVMRSIIAHCELPWDSRCVRFFESTAPVTSASAGQANKPIYRSSVGIWKHYQAELRPLMERFEAAGIEVT